MQQLQLINRFLDYLDAERNFSAHTVRDAVAAKRRGADYLGVGPVYRTPLKRRNTVGLDVIKKIREVGLPVVAIGGIDEKNIEDLLAYDISTVAVVRAVSSAGNPCGKVRNLKNVYKFDPYCPLLMTSEF